MINYQVIPLYTNDEEDYEKSHDNIGELIVLQGKIDISKQCKLVFNFNKEALIGFGTYCVRNANEYVENIHYHVEPLGNLSSNQSMGFFLTPMSSELIIRNKNCGKLEDYGVKKVYNSIENLKCSNLKVEFMVDLRFDNDYFEYHNLGFNNVADLRVFNENVDISNKCTVVLSLNKNGLIGLGTELIRLAHTYNKDSALTFNPIDTEAHICSKGLYLTPNSSIMKIECNALNNVFFYDEDFGKR